jgi:hypothetical protein
MRTTNRDIRKRQFSRKIIEWGFRKNIPRGERRVILQRILKGEEEETSNVKDHRLKPQKLRNWQRRYRDEVQMGPCSLNRVGRSSPGKWQLYGSEVEGLTDFHSKSLFLSAAAKHPRD